MFFVFKVVPSLVMLKYSARLSSIEKMLVGEHEIFVSYNSNNGFLNGIGYLMDIFNLREKDILCFTMHDGDMMTARIFQEDGMEIDYRKSRDKGKDVVVGEWFLQVDLDCVSGMTIY